MPPAFVGMSLITHFPVGLHWTTSFLVGAVPAPTDPVSASAVRVGDDALAAARLMAEHQLPGRVYVL